MSNLAPNPIWPRPLVLPPPLLTLGTQQPVISLSGEWQRRLFPPEDFWEDLSAAEWETAPVPGPVFPPRDNDQTPNCGYLRSVNIPSDYAGLRIFLRLDGVGGFSQLWVNGRFIRDHFGGFTPWCAEITDAVQPGQPALIALRSESRRVGALHTDISILREPLLMAVPPDFIAHFHADTKLDGAYQNGVLRIHTGIDFGQSSTAQVAYHLTDAEGAELPLALMPTEFNASQSEQVVEFSFENIHTWDAEHPYLYTLEARLVQDEQVRQIVSRQIGFREIIVRDRKVYVNGKEVKLRGANRHDIWPLTGRALTVEQCERDARLFKEANMNFIRTSHYPPNEAFITACDRAGIYVEDEIAVMFVKSHEHNDPEFAPLLMGQLSEMIERDRSHPSVLMWSMGNESAYGRNIQMEIEYTRNEDPTRPIIFSWADLVPFSPQPPIDIFSLHYAFYNADPGEMSDLWVGTSWNTAPGKNYPQFARDQLQGNLPILHDEYAHVPAYNVREQMRDPGVRAFWGETIARFWEAIFECNGALGGAIWAGIDDLILDPQATVYPHFEWGVIDAWKRPKPEFWMTKKAYSPIRIPDNPLANPGSGMALSIPVKNWFDHTSLNEVTARWKVGGEEGELPGPEVPPHGEGVLEIPARTWTDGELLNLTFFASDGMLLDEYNLPIGHPALPEDNLQSYPTLHVTENREVLVLTGSDFRLQFNKTSGLIEEGTCQDALVIKSGPHLHLEGITLDEWRLKSFQHRQTPEEAIIEIAGAYGEVEVRFKLYVNGAGSIRTQYTLDALPKPPLPKAWVHLSSDAGGFREVGVSFVLTGAVDRLSWRRKGFWSAYPEDHIARTEGTAMRESPYPQRFNQVPTWPWSNDSRNTILFGRYDPGIRGTNDFRSLKENIYSAAALLAGSPACLTAESDGSLAVRMEVLDNPQATIDDRDPRVKFSGEWLHLDDDPRCYNGTESLSKAAGSTAEVTFHGTGICWLGSRDTYYGKADVYLDGKLEVEGLDLSSGSANWDMPLGQDKLPRAYLFTKEDLSESEHTLRIVVRGDKHPHATNCYVSVDAFLVLGGASRADVRFILSNLWNYPEVGWVRWGNYTRDAILLEPGYSNEVKLRLTA